MRWDCSCYRWRSPRASMRRPNGSPHGLQRAARGLRKRLLRKERQLINVGRLSLLAAAWRQRETLDPELRAEVRSLVGINESRESVLARPAVLDRWQVVGRRLLEGERMTVQRTWLWGFSSQRWALILEFSAGGQPLDRTLLPGAQLEAELC